MRAAVFSDRGLIVYLNGAGWLGEMSVSSGKRNQPAAGRIRVKRAVAASQKGDNRGKILDIAKDSNSPDYSVRVVDLRLNHISKGINVFLDIERRQRHGAREPHRRLRKVQSRTCPTEGISHFGHSGGKVCRERVIKPEPVRDPRSRIHKAQDTRRRWRATIKRQDSQILLPNPKTVARGSGSGCAPKNRSGLNFIGLA